MRLYSESEARAALADVIPIVTRLRDAFVALRALQSSVAADSRGATGDGTLTASAWDEQGANRAEALNRELQTAAALLGDRDVEVKDPERGLIDFRSERDGRVVFLCYLLGEPDLLYWHELDAGFAGRQPLQSSKD